MNVRRPLKGRLPHHYGWPMRLCLCIFVAFLLAAQANLRGRAYTLQRSEANRAVRWNKKSIRFALSDSFFVAPNVRADRAEIVRAVRRALARWSAETGLHLGLALSSTQSVSSSASSGDGINLITVADAPENLALFADEGDLAGRTRVFFNPRSGAISEADIALNPNLLFSTDGTPGTFDLEATLTHELGHALGLAHSAVLGSIMRPRLRMNDARESVVDLRQLAEDDRAAARALYRPNAEWGSLMGKLLFADGGPIFGAHIFIEEAATGRVIAGGITREDGSYRIDGLPAGSYNLRIEPMDGPIELGEIARSSYAPNVFRAVASERPIEVAFNSATEFNAKLENVAPKLNPRLLGLTAHLSAVPLSLVPGRTYTVLIGGEGLDEVVAASSDSPYVAVEEVRSQGEVAGLSLLSVSVRVDAAAPVGEYSLRLQTMEGESAWIAGALLVHRPAPIALGAAEIPDATDPIWLD
ncbi:MAG: hypothetical protein C4334_08865 [Pyrinomonas sp.]